MTRYIDSRKSRRQNDDPAGWRRDRLRLGQPVGLLASLACIWSSQSCPACELIEGTPVTRIVKTGVEFLHEPSRRGCADSHWNGNPGLRSARCLSKLIWLSRFFSISRFRRPLLIGLARRLQRCCTQSVCGLPSLDRQQTVRRAEKPCGQCQPPPTLSRRLTPSQAIHFAVRSGTSLRGGNRPLFRWIPK